MERDLDSCGLSHGLPSCCRDSGAEPSLVQRQEHSKARQQDDSYNTPRADPVSVRSRESNERQRERVTQAARALSSRAVVKGKDSGLSGGGQQEGVASTS